MTNRYPNSMRGARMTRLALSVALALGVVGAAQAAAENPASKPAAHHRRHVQVATLDDRVRLLASELDLNATQQLELKRILEAQRTQVAKVWGDASVPAALRVSTTQAISDKTAEQIRALLTEEQRDKYIQPRKREEAVGASKPDVEEWMNTGPRQ